MLVNNLVLEAYRIAGIVASEGESTSSTQAVRGVDALNRLIELENINGIHIALLKDASGNLTPSSEVTVLDDFIDVIGFQYFISANLRIPLLQKSLQQFKAQASVTTLNAPPSIWYPQRTETGIDLLLYAHPAEAYPYEIQGIRKIESVTLNQDIMGDTVFYTNYLLYLLADELRLMENRPDNPKIIQRIQMYQRALAAIKPTDYSVQVSRLGLYPYSNTDPASALILQGWYP